MVRPKLSNMTMISSKQFAGVFLGVEFPGFRNPRKPSQWLWHTVAWRRTSPQALCQRFVPAVEARPLLRPERACERCRCASVRAENGPRQRPPGPRHGRRPVVAVQRRVVVGVRQARAARRRLRRHVDRLSAGKRTVRTGLQAVTSLTPPCSLRMQRPLRRCAASVNK